MYNLLHKEQLHVSALFIGHLQVDKWETLWVPTPPFLHNTCEISYPLHPWPPHCTQPTQVECSCLPMFLIYQPEDGQWKGPKYVVVLYVINYTYLYHHIVVLDRYTNSNLVLKSNFQSFFRVKGFSLVLLLYCFFPVILFMFHVFIGFVFVCVYCSCAAFVLLC